MCLIIRKYNGWEAARIKYGSVVKWINGNYFWKPVTTCDEDETEVKMKLYFILCEICIHILGKL